MKKTLSIFFILLSLTTQAAAYPQRIISLAPSVTKSLYLLGAEECVIAVTIYCPRVSAATEVIGTVLEPNIEKIVSLKPDLVIASKEGNQPQTVATLNKLGITVYVMESVDNFSDICRGFEDLGKIIGKEEKAKGIIDEARKKIQKVNERTKGKEPVSVFWEVGVQPLFTVSRKSFVNDFIERAGGTNIFGGFKTRYPQISREEVVRLNPAVIIMVTMGDVTEKEEEFWRQFKELSAVKNNRIHVLRNANFTDPTPAALADGIEIIADLLHPRAKDKQR